MEKGKIIAFYYCLGVVAIVARLVGQPWSTVKNFLTRVKIQGHENNLTRPGRPQKLNRRAQRAIVRIARQERKITRRELRVLHAPDVCLHTVDRVLRNANIKNWRAKGRPLLKEEHVAKRLAWALARKDWTAEEFEGVIYSDEYSVEKSKDPCQQWVFRTPTEK